MRADLPTDPTELACLLLQSNPLPDVRQALQQRLWEFVQAELQLLPRCWRIDPDLLVDAAHCVVFDRIDRFDPVRFASFIPFCRVVGRRYLIDRFRRRRRRSLDTVQDRSDYHFVAAHRDKQLLAVLTAPFSAQDEAHVRRWNPRVRLTLLVLGRIWGKASAGLWAQTLQECRVMAPFPPADFDPLDEREAGFTLVSQALQVSRNLVSQWWHRNRAQLAELECFGDFPRLRAAFRNNRPLDERGPRSGPSRVPNGATTQEFLSAGGCDRRNSGGAEDHALI